MRMQADDHFNVNMQPGLTVTVGKFGVIALIAPSLI